MTQPNITAILHGTRHKTAKERDAARKCADCGHPRSYHYKGRSCGYPEGMTGPRCSASCRRFRSRPKAKRRSIRTTAIQAQHDWMQAAGFRNREGHGADGVYYGPDGYPLLVGEHKHRPAPSYWEKDIAQAASYGEQGKPFAVAGYTSKPGPGRKARRYMVIDAEQWPSIVER